MRSSAGVLLVVALVGCAQGHGPGTTRRHRDGGMDGGGRVDAAFDAAPEDVAGCTGMVCGGRCVDIRTDPANCGGCGRSCAPGSPCMGGACRCGGDCDGRVCGDDGCGGSCGMCGMGTHCEAGRCISDCTPSCAGRACGGDGCGGSCGSCPSGTRCEGSACVCAPSCGGRACGGDGCGGSCGSCPSGTRCEGSACVCAPSCSGRECGGDGCGGSCGSCPRGERCNSGSCECATPDWRDVGGRCVPSCGILLNDLGLPDSGGGCCPAGCAGTEGGGPGDTWDCTYCCSDPPGCS